MRIPLVILLLISTYCSSFYAAAAEDKTIPEISFSSLLQPKTINPESLLPLSQDICDSLFTFIQKASLNLLPSPYKTDEKPISEEKVVKYLNHLPEMKLFKRRFSQSKSVNLTVDLIAFIITTASIELSLTRIQEEPRSLFYCTCTPIYDRILWVVITILSLAPQIGRFSPEHPFIYCSIGSGELFQEYLLMAALIKLGVPAIHAHFIDEKYITVNQSNNDFEQEKEMLPQLILEFEEEVVTRKSIFALSKKINLLFEAVQEKSSLEDYDRLDLTYWPDFKTYERRLTHYFKKNVPIYKTFFKPDLVSMVDPDSHNKPVFIALSQIFTKIKDTYLKSTGLAASLTGNVTDLYKAEQKQHFFSY